MTDTAIQTQTCCDDYDPSLIPVDEARRRLAEGVQPVSGFEKVALRDALDRILAEEVVSPIDVPSHTNSAMDGYAVDGAALPAEGVCELRVVGTSWAGRPLEGAVGAGEAARIMTGAVMPRGTDTVIMQEHVERDGDVVKFNAGHKRGQNVRAAGEDLGRGQHVLAPGRCISPAELGLLASLGVAEVRVCRRVRVAFFSTGDELRSIGEALDEGAIYDSNRYTLFGMLRRLGVEILDMGVIPDQREATREAFQEAARNADAIITSGGVSVGEADYVTETLHALGEVAFWKIAMKPGRPLAFGRVGTAAFFGLPGNPVSVMVTFYQFVLPTLRRMMGETQGIQGVLVKARCATPLRKVAGRTEFQRGVLEHGEGGELVVRTTGKQGSGILRSMSEANCFIILPVDSTGVEAGETVDVQPIPGLT